MDKKEMYKKIEKNMYAIFVDNLPFAMPTSWLWQLCNLEGLVVDVFMSRKQRAMKPGPFAFVQFISKQDALKAIRNLDSLIIRGCAIKLKEARYSREAESKKEINHTNAWSNGDQEKDSQWGNKCDGRTYKEVVVQKQGDAEKQVDVSMCNTNGRQRMVNDGEKLEKTVVVYGEVDEVMMKKSSRSIVGESIALVSIEVREECLCKDWYTIKEVKPIGTYKTLITFETREDMEDAMGSDYLLNYFEDIRRWSDEEYSQTQRLWIECLGMPPHAWSSANLRKIGEHWGSVVCLDKKIEDKCDLGSAKILIDTCFFLMIQS